MAGGNKGTKPVRKRKRPAANTAHKSSHPVKKKRKVKGK